MLQWPDSRPFRVKSSKPCSFKNTSSPMVKQPLEESHISILD